MNPHPRPRISPRQLLHRPQYPLPRRKPVQVASLEQGIRTHGGVEARFLAVLLYDDIVGAVDVEVGGHLRGFGAVMFGSKCLRDRSTGTLYRYRPDAVRPVFLAGCAAFGIFTAGGLRIIASQIVP